MVGKELQTMSKKYQNSKDILEVKKIKAKLETTSLIASVAVLLIISTIQTAQAEPTNAIYGIIDGVFVFIADDGINNIIILEKDGIQSKHYDSIVTEYSSGGFKMKNLETGILVFAHPIENGLYRLVVITADERYRLIGVFQEISELDPTTEIIEPISSVGEDIAKYDVSNSTSRDDEKDTFLMTFNTYTYLDSMNLNDKFELNGYVYDVRTAERLDADLTLEISRDDYILSSVKQPTGIFGTVTIEIDDIIYPLYYPEKCYEVKLTMEYGNYTAVWTDDFVMRYPSDTRVWEPNFNWMIDARWNYLPQSFQDEPRQSILKDGRCN